MIGRKNHSVVGLFFIAACSAILIGLTGGAGALTASNGAGNALKISPVRTDLTIKPGEKQTVDVFIQNMSASPARLHPIINDFTVRPDNETGQPDIILDETQTAPAHSLKQFVGKLDDITLAPNEQKNIKVVVSVPAGTAGGGYYGAVRFEPAGNSGKQVNLSGSVGSLILLKVPGDITEQLSIVSFDVRKGSSAGSFFTSSKDIKSLVRFKNSGNIQVQPFGKLILKNQSGKTLGSYEINNTDPRGNVLPDSIRRFETDLKKVGSIGKFTVEGNFGYGTNGQLLTASKTFYVVPLWTIILFVLVVALILLAIFVLPRLVRAYNARIIAKAAKSRKR
jgi:hypothetical protein